MKLVKDFIKAGHQIELDDTEDLRAGDIVRLDREHMLVTYVRESILHVVPGYMAHLFSQQSKDHAVGTECILTGRYA